MVDAALYLEGERYQSYRLLRVIKNRFGSNSELAVLDMGSQGLEDVVNPSMLFMSTPSSDSSTNNEQRVSGCAVTSVMEGSRPLLCEVQAISTAPSYAMPPGAGGMNAATFAASSFPLQVRHRQNGLDYDRFHLLLAVLAKRGGIPVGRSDLFVNVVGGMRLREPAADLSVRNLSSRVVFIELDYNCSTGVLILTNFLSLRYVLRLPLPFAMFIGLLTLHSSAKLVWLVNCVLFLRFEWQQVFLRFPYEILSQNCLCISLIFSWNFV